MTDHQCEVIAQMDRLIKNLEWECAPFTRLLSEAAICWPASFIFNDETGLLTAVEHPKYLELKGIVDACVQHIQQKYAKEIELRRASLRKVAPHDG